MKRIAIQLGLFLFFIGATSLHSQINLTNGLLLHYPFDGNFLDASGNGHPGSNFGCTHGLDRHGQPNSALSLDGVNDYLVVTNTTGLQPTFPVTITGWIYLDDLSNNNIFVNCFQSNEYNGFTCNVVNSYLHVYYGDGGAANINHRHTKKGTTQLSTQTWYHVAFIVRGANNMDIYLNGKQECGVYSGFGGAMTYANYEGRIGAGSNPTTPYYNGKIDDLRFYNRELNIEEIRLLADFPSQDTTICAGDTVTLDAGYGSLVSWSPVANLLCNTCTITDATPGATTTYHAVTANTPGCNDDVYIEVVVDTACMAVSCDSISMAPAFVLTPSALDLNCQDISTGMATTIEWIFGDGNNQFVSPGTNVIHTYASQGVYEVCQVTHYEVNGDFVCSDTLCKWVEIVELAVDNGSATNFHLFPNPTSGHIKVRLDGQEFEGLITVYDLRGQLLFSNEVMGMREMDLDLGHLAAGTYLLGLETNGGARTVRRLIKL